MQTYIPSFFQHEKNPRHFFQNMLVILYFYKLPFEFRSLHAQFMIPGHLTSLVRVFEKCRKPLGPILKCMRWIDLSKEGVCILAAIYVVNKMWLIFLNKYVLLNCNWKKSILFFFLNLIVIVQYVLYKWL